MAIEFVLDTHALVWFVTGDARLGAQARAVMSDPAVQMLLPVTALAEACYIVDRGRTSIPTPLDLFKALRGDKRIRIAPLTAAVVRRTLAMSAIPEMHDRQIAATALRVIDRGGTAVLLTKDASITASGLVPVMW
ncbi:MAG: type II toxin-antitoxin system VapC family toxin [Myxococcales bacterium]